MVRRIGEFVGDQVRARVNLGLKACGLRAGQFCNGLIAPEIEEPNQDLAPIARFARQESGKVALGSKTARVNAS